MSTLIGYVRVSTGAQAEDGHGLEIQEQELRAWCDQHGHTLVGVERDEGISGTKDSGDRPGLAAALAAVVEGAGGIVVHHLDRLARSLTVQEAVLSQVWKHGGQVWSVDVGEILRDDPDDPMRTFVRQVMGAAAQLERGMIAARLRGGRRMKHSKGGYAYGSPRFGHRAEEGELVPDAVEQATVARIAELRAGAASLREIVATLENEHRPPKRGGRWHVETVRRVVARLEAASQAA